jgi:hypothetical protein
MDTVEQSSNVARTASARTVRGVTQTVCDQIHSRESIYLMFGYPNLFVEMAMGTRSPIPRGEFLH